MGLDMYLIAEKYLSRFDDGNKIQQINDLFGINNASDDYGVNIIQFHVSYWRKANAIHAWFVKNIQGGVDECQKSYVGRDQLRQLVDICKTVLADNEKAPALLPTASGFFFGSTEYDEGYYNDLRDTVKQIERVLEDPALEKMDFYYRSSW
jgi:hypothetical protein